MIRDAVSQANQVVAAAYGALHFVFVASPAQFFTTDASGARRFSHETHDPNGARRLLWHIERLLPHAQAHGGHLAVQLADMRNMLVAALGVAGAEGTPFHDGADAIEREEHIARTAKWITTQLSAQSIAAPKAHARKVVGGASVVLDARQAWELSNQSDPSVQRDFLVAIASVAGLEHGGVADAARKRIAELAT